MANHSIIDRRKNPSGKNLPNRKRFIDRVKDQVKDNIKKSVNKRSITSNEGEQIVIDGKGVEEPSFNYDFDTGEWHHIAPGNKDFLPGDIVPKPKKNSGNRGDKAGTGNSEDDFTFSISKEEYLDIVFEDLELPNLVKESKDAAVNFVRSRAGYTKQGSASNLDLVKSLRNSLGRRIALAFPLDRKIKELEEQISNEQDETIKETLSKELSDLKIRRQAVAYIDPLDIRYKRFEKTPVPASKAVMFCLMDVSGSMTEERKELAKRFFLLLYLFLNRKYKKVDVIFIRHTESAEEVNEHTFFYDTRSGGTQISTALELMQDIMQSRYDLIDWNVYAVQASDGDNAYQDDLKVESLLRELLPKLQYYVFNEVATQQYTTMFGGLFPRTSNTLQSLITEFKNIAVVQTNNVDDVIPVFRKVFAKNDR